MKHISVIEKIALASIAAFTLWTLPAAADTTSTPASDITISSSTISIDTPSTTPTNVPTSTIIIRYQDRIIFNEPVELTSTLYHDNINNIDYALATPTVFSALVSADNHSDAFTISDAQYNQAYNSFYLACLDIAAASSTENACYNWNYAINNNYPATGIDAYPLTGNETVYIYFSNPWQITADTSTFPVETTTTFHTWRYQFDNLQDPWTSDGNNLISISIPNPNPTGWWDQTIPVTTTYTDALGDALYRFDTTGTYFAQISSADYSKWSNPITLTVQEKTPADTNPQTPTGGNSSGTPTIPIQSSEIDAAVQKIIRFLKSKQSTNGSIQDLPTSDWAAVSFGSAGIYSSQIATSSSLFDYLNTTPITSTTDALNICTEYPRHILGLLAAGTAKNNSQIIDLKNQISNSCFNNGTVGQAGINDDIFITLALLATDEPITSELLQTAIAAIKHDQQESGAFTWNGYPGQDVTGAAINALRYVSTLGIFVEQTIFDKAKEYLHSTQLADGGWTGYGNTSDPLTTSWALYGINALGENQSQWTNSQNQNPWSVLVKQLHTDGYYQSSWSEDRIDWFATKHAIPAMLGKSWPVILPPIDIPTSNQGSTGGGSIEIVTTTAISTSSVEDVSIIATSTPEITTTTIARPETTGEILGVKIVQNDPPTPTPQKPSLTTQRKITIKNIDVTKTPIQTTTETASTTTQTTDSPDDRRLAKYIFITSLCGIGIFGIIWGFNQIKK